MTWRSGLVATALAAGWLLPAAAQTPTWRHGVIEPKSDAGFTLMFTQRDFAAKHGLAVEYVSLKNETLGLRAILSGDLDSYEGAPPVAAAARGADVKVIGCPWLEAPHAIFGRAGVQTLKDLEGHTFATSAPGSMPDVVGRAALSRAGVPDGTVRLANVGSDADRYRALAAGVVDAAVISSEYIPTMDKEKVHLIARASDVMPELVRTCYMSTGKTLANRMDDAAKFLATEMNALAFALANKDATIALTRQETGQKPEDPRAAYVFELVEERKPIDATVPIPTDRLAAMEQTLQSLGLVQTPVDVAGMIDARPRQKALETR